MKTQRSPNRWSCLPTSFAMLLDVPLKEIIEKCGHDGSEIWWPRLQEPLCRRAFHIQEMIWIAHSYGVPIVAFEARPTCCPNVFVEMFEVHTPNIFEVMYKSQGVLTGETCNGMRHAVAWNGRTVLDPGGKIKSRDGLGIEVFYRASL